MRTVNRAVVVGTAALSAVALSTTAASAAPSSKGTTTVAPSALTGSVLQGLTGPASLTSAGAVFGIVGQPSNGVIKHVGGLRVAELNPNTAATSLTLSNFWIDTKNGTVSALVNDAVRAVVFNVGAGGVLTFTNVASEAVAGSEDLTGKVAGTATVVTG